MKRILMISAGALALTAMVAGAFTIDGFSATAMGVEDPSGGSFPFTVLEAAVASDCIGGFRRLTADQVTGTNGSVVVVANDPLFVDQASMSLSGDTTGTGIFEYGSFTAGAGALNANFSADEHFGIKFVSLDWPVSAEITVTNGVDGPTSYSTAIPGGQINTTFAVPFSSFGAFDFADVDGIRYKFTALIGATDMVVDAFDTGHGVPEPASITLLGLLGFGLIRRRR